VSRSNTLTSSNGTSGSSSSALACPGTDERRGRCVTGSPKTTTCAARRGRRLGEGTAPRHHDHDDVERRRHGIVGTS
jgi:hypothetical protein